MSTATMWMFPIDIEPLSPIELTANAGHCFAVAHPSGWNVCECPFRERP